MYRIIPNDENKKVINPDTHKRVPKEGIVIPKITTYWKRRKEDGDITIENLSKKKSHVVASKKIEEKK
ncbi:MAG: DUF2635 domain-containing protein [Promethearchaeota archaeon]